MKYCDDHATSLLGLERIYTGGGPVYPQLLEGLQRIAPCAVITGVYGSTEAEPIACITYSEIAVEDKVAMLAGRGLLAGSPVPMIRLRHHAESMGFSRRALHTAGVQRSLSAFGIAG